MQFLRKNSFDQIKGSEIKIINNSIHVVIGVHYKDIDKLVGTEGAICINPNIITDKPKDFGELENLGETQFGNEDKNTELNQKVLFFAGYFEKFIKNKLYYEE